MKYMIAMDSGGTKTESVLVDETGHILARDVTAGANGLEVGLETALERISAACYRLYRQLPAGENLSAIYGGVAACADYFPWAMENQLYPMLPPSERVRFEGDGGCLIGAVMGHQDGACIISGTGSSLYIRNGDKLQLFGGWGYLIDTEGSGYTIGRDAFLAAFRSLDGRGPKTVLYDLIGQQLGGPPETKLPQIYQGGRPCIASFAGTVFAARKMGDGEAIRIFDHAVTRLADLLRVGARELKKPFQVVLGGGLFAAFPELWEAVKDQAPAEATPVLLKQRPILGAAVEARYEAGLPDDPAFRETFTRDYEALTAAGK